MSNNERADYRQDKWAETEAKLSRVVALHQPVARTVIFDNALSLTRCATCGIGYPCATVSALSAGTDA